VAHFVDTEQRVRTVAVELKLVIYAACYAMMTYGGVDIQIHVFLSSALVVGEWSASRPGCFTLGERDPGTHSIGAWVSCRAGLDCMVK
jgi:hypothetical protein